MKNFDAERKPGRFIKKDSPLIDRISIIDYSFGELITTAVTYPDNSNNNIIRHQFHDSEELKVSIVESDLVTNVLTDPRSPPVIMPRNFTSDWIKDKNKERNRKKKIFDDDEEDEDDDGYQSSINLQSSMASKNGPNDPIDSQLLKRNHGSELPSKDGKSKTIISQKDDALSDLARGDLSIEDSLTAMGAVIKDYGSKSESEMKNEDASHSDKTQEDAIGTANHSSDDFIPIETEGLAPMGGLEDAAIQEYQNRKRDLEIEASQEKERGWSEGFQSGYREGEEKAVAEFRAKASELFQNINHLFQDLESLQSHILQQAQDNFYELTQALGEAVIEREIDINPELFKSLIQRAIKESMDSDKFTIKMNSQQISQIKTLDIGEMVNKIVVDESLQKGEFKLESELSTVKSGVKKIIRDLIDNANIDLFSQDEDVAS